MGIVCLFLQNVTKEGCCYALFSEGSCNAVQELPEAYFASVFIRKANKKSEPVRIHPVILK
ncbi:hypothetical protein Runsl_4475 [Runella slithyformis DSM 19594]|uniref:Uncharacterized protein n=1 Tax=Runella slithyformis (strain ATCC 29530 / DSM 19594 / LMG 11500 / NCIMB 11436 / LSU 4) TaxID=761193 RepID=A0A7U3ZP96_RUNSL|nr:hypothetical protein Runsl_4475 [Runella slithyformis DSM 19594]